MTTRYFKDRVKIVSELKAKGVEVYRKFAVTSTFKGFLNKYKDLGSGEQLGHKECLAGRVNGKHKSSKHILYTLCGGGEKIDAYAKAGDDLTTTMPVMYGDIVGVTGYPSKSKHGKLSIDIKSMAMLSPCLHNLPALPKDVAKFSPGSPRDALKYSLKPDVRARKRYLDLLLNENVRDLFLTRSTIISYLRKFLLDRDFLEVETPILDHIPGVGAAAPFATYFKDMKLYLRVAPEVKLKMLLAGGLDRVFEIGKQFRNESIDATHHPEFTSCEAYMTFADYEDMMSLTEDFLSGLVKDLTGGYIVKFPDSKNGEPIEIDFTPPFRRLDILEELREMGGLAIPADLSSEEANDYLRQACDKCGVVCKPPYRTARLLDKLINHILVPSCINPTFVINHPKVMSLMAKSHKLRPEITERFELYLNQQELCNAYTELNDPMEQRERFSELLKELKGGDYEATELDEEFCESLEYGLPPSAGWGIGLDRLVMFLTYSQAIKDVLLFPLLKPKVHDKKGETMEKGESGPSRAYSCSQRPGWFVNRMKSGDWTSWKSCVKWEGLQFLLILAVKKQMIISDKHVTSVECFVMPILN
ncbi:lysine--tRNA ligase-like isoform X3 [Silene latifolia]|uniref:lysine--tRNA ligase-like isoform X3 n=1 Tax=Silene latifolia TaxID=37657 RepID=UPI003D77F648